jgi:WD40 repeat protein
VALLRTRFYTSDSTKIKDVSLVELREVSRYSTLSLLRTHSKEVIHPLLISILEFDGGIGIVEMLFRCNILALVGGGSHPKFPMNKVLLWDDHQYKCIGELSFKTFVKAVKLRKDKVVVVLESRIYVYNFADLRLIDAIDTCLNPKGLCALSSDPNISVLATPDKNKGSVKVTIYEKNLTHVIAAHTSSLSYVALNFAGTLLATASDKGTLIRLFSTEDGSPL